MFTITMPVGSLKEVPLLLENGADQLYCGMVIEGGKWQYSRYFSRRQFPDCNLKSVDELRKAVFFAHAKNVPVHLTLNEPYYPKSLYPLLIEYIKIIQDTGIDALIVADFNLILMIRKYFSELPIHLSTCGSAYNSEAIKFYEELGVSRIILPRHLLLDEIRELLKHSTAELEILIMNDRCTFDDGLCYFVHSLKDGEDIIADGGGCGLKYQVVNFQSPESAGGEENEWPNFLKKTLPGYFSNPCRKKACGACALYYLKDYKLSIKISGRQNPTQQKITDLSFIKKVCTFLKGKELSFSHFSKNTKDIYKLFYGSDCAEVQCYY